MKSIYFFIGITLLTMPAVMTPQEKAQPQSATTTLETERKSSQIPKTQRARQIKISQTAPKPIYVLKESSSGNKTLIAIAIASLTAGILIGKNYPELVDQATTTVKNSVSSGYECVSEYINKGIETYTKRNQDSSTVTVETSVDNSTKTDIEKETEKVETSEAQNFENSLITSQHRTENPDERQD